MKALRYRPIKKGWTDITVFRGLNRSVNTGFSQVSASNSARYTEFSGMRNLSSDEYPQLSVRKKRGRLNTMGGSLYNPQNGDLLFADGKMIFASTNGINYDSVLTMAAAVTGWQSADANNKPIYHRLTLFGNRVIIMPEKLIFNLSNRTYEKIESSVSGTPSHAVSGDGNTTIGRYNDNGFTIEKVELDEAGAPRPVRLILEQADSLDNDQAQVSGLTEEDRTRWKGIYLNAWSWVEVGDTVEAMGESPSGLYRCYAIGDGSEQRTTSNGRSYYPRNVKRHFVKIENYYVRIWKSIPGISAGDFVTISGMTDSVTVPETFVHSSNVTTENGVTTVNTVISDWGNYLSALNGQTFKVYYADESSFVIKADIDKSVPYSGSLTVSRTMPQLDGDKLIEVNNRIWGCSSQSNEIFASKLGDVKNWRAYSDGITTDSFAATVGSEGEFTGIARQNDSVIFFKENWIIKLYGTKPSNFTLASYSVPGVEKGSSKSLVWVRGVLYYLSPRGVCQYSPGGQPVVISEDAFGGKKYKNGVGGRHGDKYYLSALNEDGLWELMVYDTKTGLWHREDNIRFLSTADYNGKLYYIDGDSGKITCAERGDNLIAGNSGYVEEEYIDWYAETGNMYDKVLFKKHITRIDIGFKPEEYVRVKVLAKFREGGSWQELTERDAVMGKVCVIPTAVQRSDFLKLRIEGRGRCCIRGIGIEYSTGSDR